MSLTCCSRASCHSAFNSSARHCSCRVFHCCRVTSPLSRTRVSSGFCLQAKASSAEEGLSLAAHSASLSISVSFADMLAGKSGCSQGGEGAGSGAPADTTRESQQIYKARRAPATLDSWRKVCKALETSVQGILNAGYPRKHAKQISPLPLPTSTCSKPEHPG